jgi:hypothetical protein
MFLNCDREVIEDVERVKVGEEAKVVVPVLFKRRRPRLTIESLCSNLGLDSGA